MPPDLIIYGLIAAGLIFWLRSILGTKNGDERERPSPLLSNIDNTNSNLLNFDNKHQQNSESLISDLFANPKGNISIENKQAEEALISIAKLDRTFNVVTFLRSAQDAFVYVVESFADNDLETLKDLLGPQVFEAFEKAIIARQKSGETMKTEIRSITNSQVLSAKLEGSRAQIIIRFIAEEITCTKNQLGEIIYGHPDKINQMRDVWAFSRDLNSRDPRWFVIETREDIIKDNATIPNSH